MARRPTRFERSLREIHGDSFDFVEVQPRQWRDRSYPERISVWWANATPLERFSRIWWWTVCGVVGGGLGACTTVFFFG